MAKLLITTLVDSRYLDYVELFAWCAKRSYPEYSVKVFRKEEVFPGYPDRGYTTNALRMVVPASYYEEFDFIWVTDIDIMILREEPGILEYHAADLEGQCFSNSIRTASGTYSFGKQSWDGTQCLSGLHFFTPRWLTAIEPQAAKYRELLKTAEVGWGFDGRMLFLMCKNLGYKIPGKKPLIKRHHGIHIGTFRLWGEGLQYVNRPGSDPMTKEQADSCIKKRVKDWKVTRWKEYMQDPMYSHIVSRMTNPDVISQVKKLEEYCNE